MVSQSTIDESLREDERMRRWGFWLAENLPPVTVGSGLTKHKRPPLPEEVLPRYPRVRRALEEYWQAIWPTDPDGEWYQLDAAINWARSNTGPNSKTPQHIHWYAQSILHQARFLSPEVDRTIDGHAEHVMQSAVESAYKIGVLFREATWKLDHEKAALDAYEHRQKRLEGSARGGDTTQRVGRERKDLFARMALGSVRDWIFLSKKKHKFAVWFWQIAND